MKQFILITFLSIALNFHAFGSNLPYFQRMAQSQMTRSGALGIWDYPTGLFVESILKVYDLYGGDKYYNYALNFAKATVNTSGKIATKYKFTDFTLDNINSGVALLDIYKRKFSPIQDCLGYVT